MIEFLASMDWFMGRPIEARSPSNTCPYLAETIRLADGVLLISCLQIHLGSRVPLKNYDKPNICQCSGSISTNLQGELSFQAMAGSLPSWAITPDAWGSPLKLQSHNGGCWNQSHNLGNPGITSWLTYDISTIIMPIINFNPSNHIDFLQS